jgi:hypothetical protein
MSKTKVEIEFKTDAELYRVYIDGKKVIFDNEKCSVELEVGTCYSLTWFVMGEEGAKYSIKIIKPLNIKLFVSRVLDYYKKDAGQFWLELPAN